MDTKSIGKFFKILLSTLPVIDIALAFITIRFIAISKETDALRSTIGTIVIFIPIIWLIGMIISFIRLKFTENKKFFIFNLAFNIPLLIVWVLLMSFPYN